MKKIFNIKRHAVILDTDTLEISALEPKTRGIDDIYVAPDDAVVQWGEGNDAVPVKKGDIIVTFYNTDLGKDYTIVTSDDWKSMLDHADKIVQERKINWAAEVATDNCSRKD